MAMKSDIEYPHLVPPDDIFPGEEKLFRTPCDLTAEQFSLLAAAWAEGALSGESLSELESVIEADSEKRAFAESFRRLRLNPGTEKWAGRNKLLRSSPEAKVIRRMIIYTIATAAAVLAVITFRPAAEHQVLDQAPLVLPAITITADIPKPATPDIMIDGTMNAYQSRQAVPEPATLIASAENQDIRRDSPLELGAIAETPAITAGINSKELISIDFMKIPPPEKSVAERNWIVNGFAALSKLKTADDSPIDGYNIAGSVVKGVNTVLGWDMELEKVTTDKGEPVALNFSSGLLTFSSSVKKSSQ